ncbi:MAG: homoserine dehydrogenase [Archaeoglobaceae archaeon]|nr:homoserine dehydrogenase [Archaeoglobaceae archaeon]MCX8152636.1 homoserine dehydrogenase [Archaeoglobaceae archaeon]MDW8014082.1 homoserine dehydrogenase [Archaeoglobaceae archaeon]
MKIAIVGFGNVGQSFLDMLLSKKEFLEKRIGKIEISFIADSKSSVSGDFDPLEALRMKRTKGRLRDDKKAKNCLKELEFDVLVECSTTKINGGEAVEHMLIAIEKGANVVTSNKGIAFYFDELMKLAERKNVKLMYEATVGAAIPIIRVLRTYFSTFTIKKIAGILNGTCNYILSRMEEEGLSYEQVLAEAKELGIAETDPSYDVDGIDAAIKLVILANTIGIRSKFEDVKRKGISWITPEAFKIAAEKGYTIRLIAEASKELIVEPRLVKFGHPLALKGTINTILVYTEEAGTFSFAGRGAGKYETAAAMISDLVAIYDDR